MGGDRRGDGDLDAWAAGARAQEAATVRARQRWLQQQAAEQADITSLLVELCERGSPVSITTAAGRCFPHARIVSVGNDCVTIATERRRVVLASRAVVALQPHDEHYISLGADVRSTADESMAGLVRRAAHDRAPVAIRVDGVLEPFVGELQVCGKDVVVIRVTRTGALSYLTLASVSEMSFDSG